MTITPEKLHAVLKARDKGMYPEGPNPDVPWILVVAKYLPQATNWLDIGCRSGFYAVESLRQVRGDKPAVSIADPNPEMLRFAEDYVRKDRIEPAVVPYGEYAESAYDLVTCREESPDIDAIKRTLKPGGIYIQFYPVRNLTWKDRLDFILSREAWLKETAEKLGMEPVEAKGWGSKWSTDIDTIVGYFEAAEDRTVTDSERQSLLDRFAVGAGVCVEEFGMYGVFRK